MLELQHEVVRNNLIENLQLMNFQEGSMISVQNELKKLRENTIAEAKQAVFSHDKVNTRRQSTITDR